MRNFSTFVAAAFVGTALFVGSAMAEKVCKPVVTTTGAASVLESAAPKKAREAWRREVTARYGEFWNDWSKAQNANDKRNCGRAYAYFYRCEASGRPCSEESSDGNTCVSIGQGENRKCDDFIVQAQIALKDSGCHAGKVDGVHGSVTRDALRCFQKKNGLKLTGELDLTTAKALNIQ